MSTSPPRAPDGAGDDPRPVSAAPSATAPGAAPPDPSPDGEVRAVRSPVDVLDVRPPRVHRPVDLLGATLSTVIAVIVVVLATYAQNTTTGVAEDVQGFATLLRRILFVPVNVLVGFTTVVVPIAVLTELALRRLGRQLLQAVLAAIGALLLVAALYWTFDTFGSEGLRHGLSVRLGGVWQLTIPEYAAMLTALLTVAGPRSRRRSVAWSWNLLWVTTGVVLITAAVSLAGIGLALLVGRTAGLLGRYVGGVDPERAYARTLLAGIRRAGVEPATVTRVPDPALLGDRTTATVEGLARLPQGTPAQRALVRAAGDRLYDVTTDDGRHLDLLVFDGDRQVVGMITRLWRSLRLRGLEGRSALSLRQATERAALLSYAASAAGVRTPQLLSIAEAEDSMLLLQESTGSAVPLSDLDADDVDDDVLHAIWAQLQLGHAAGIAHRALTSDAILVERGPTGPRVWLTAWEQGDVASSELARRMDTTQMIALLALRVGAERAVGSAAEVLPDGDIEAIGPLLQTVALPRRTRDEMRAHKEVLAELRSALVARLPEADVHPEQLVRFGARTLFTIVLTIVAVFAVLTAVNVAEIGPVLAASDWRYSALAAALGMVTLLGAGLAFVAFSPVRLPVWRATLVQTAATFVALAAPAGIGPAALNLRMLTRRGVSTTLAGATVALVQVSQFITTLLLLLVLTVTSGVHSPSSFSVSPTMLVALAVLAALVGIALLFPQVRAWVQRRVGPTMRQTLPRLIEVLGQPWRLALALGGNVLMTMGYVLAFDAALAALGQHASLVQVALVYLTGNTAGAVIPTPGGIGTVESALGLGLYTITGINAGVATTVALLFRLLTFWLRIPFGWMAMRYLTRVGEL
ncbi:flippase-like domain-containing protein [Cellulomonas sp. zg-ZUI199]|uniref:Flippase-like domain-containing protein n=1 Tax=Cellulomonas wangleii TaxID=2816956 RepID=A0ABX8D442_9CELL|nr:lysylphosphatidylglycerol synthase transmembrane domain-containing protein [Cellulomonas wangleii]MBO0923931.1 flippase-like domain-containing protein [Cellulomonas wangleii]MBO0924213.1 flippase-like domain-containing protein [Cellulomonas wangleii]QVI62226.1 flippase-like domain-containing protein [Cellulomonas wangleii]